MAEEGKRIRVSFKDDDILSETQKSGGLTRSWVLLKPRQHDTISDVASHLLHAFQLHRSCPHGLLLSISGFALPAFESSHILKDGEIIRVQKRNDVLSVAGNNAANGVKKLKAVEKQPVNSGILLLANEEFEKEKGGYESDEPEEVTEENDEEDLLEDVENTSSGNAYKRNAYKRNCKRKAAEKLQSSKGKKKRSDVTASASNAVHMDNGRKDDSNAGYSVENNGEPTKLVDKSSASGLGMSTDKVQENKEIEDAKVSPEETKKVPSRNARRKSAKRRWLHEMSKIQKQNATGESEGLRNWKEDQAKAGKKQVDCQVKGLKKWKNHQTDNEGSAAAGQPKGLRHWSTQDNWILKGKKRMQGKQNDDFRKIPNGMHDQQIKTGDGMEQPTQNGDGLQQSKQKQGDAHGQPSQKSAVEECKNQNGNASEQLNQESGEENEIVPIVIRPGHIRFEPLDEEQAVQKDHVPQETFQWNGITSKKKGQKWGKESRPRNYKASKKELSERLSSEKEEQADEATGSDELPPLVGMPKVVEHCEILKNEKEKQAEEEIDFDKLPPLVGMPKKGDLLAYRILELSPSWTPELSPFRVGKVSWYSEKFRRTLLVPVPEYPIVSKKGDEDEVVQLDTSLYKEDGSLLVDFSALIDVRIFNNGGYELGNQALSCASEGSAGDVHTPKTVLPSIDVPNQGNAGVNIWDQLSETLNAKKEQLSKENGWGRKPSSGGNWENALKAQPSDENNSHVQQSSGSSTHARIKL